MGKELTPSPVPSIVGIMKPIKGWSTSRGPEGQTRIHW